MFISNITLILFSIICSAFAAPIDSCEVALKDSFSLLQESYQSTGYLSSAQTPRECSGLTSTIDEAMVSYKVNWNAFCQTNTGLYNRTMTSYSYLSNLNLTAAEDSAMVAATSLTEIIANASCSSGLFFVPDGTDTGGWDVWYEVINISSTDCQANFEPGDLFGSIGDNLVAIARWSKSSGCTIIELPAEESNHTRIILRFLHNQESIFNSVGDVGCYLQNPSFRVETEKC